MSGKNIQENASEKYGDEAQRGRKKNQKYNKNKNGVRRLAENTEMRKETTLQDGEKI